MKKLLLLATLTTIALLSGCGGGSSSGGGGHHQVTLQSIAVTATSTTIPLGTIQSFTAIGTYSDHSTSDLTAAATWASSATSVATAAGSGVVTATGIGTSTITATSGGVSGTASLTVSSANVVSIRIQPANSTISNGTTSQLAALVTFDDGSTLNVSTTSGVAWSSSDTTVATIGAGNGFAASKAVGTTVITASFGSATDTTNLTVNNSTIQSIAVSPANGLIAPGLTQKFTAIGTFSDGSSQNISNIVTWASDNTATATVSNNAASVGVATGVAFGVANISASFTTPVPPVVGSTQLKVSNATLQSITVTPGPSTIATSEILQFSATGNFSDGTSEPLSFVATWHSTQPTVAGINNAGLATGLTAGSTDITATYNSITSSPVTMSVNGSPLVSLAVTCAHSQFAVNTSEPCSAVGTLADSTTQNMTPVVHWTSSQNGVATISNTSGLRGNITGVTAGTATITAYLNGVVGSTDVTVSGAHLTSIDIAPGSPSITLGGTQVFQAMGTFDDGSTQNLTSEPAYLVQLEGDDRAFVWDVIFVNWTTSDANVAVINKAGVATSTGLGTATISATLDGATGTSSLTVQ